MTSATTTQQIHRFLVSRIGMIFEELAVQTGLEIKYNDKNLDRIASDIECYIGFDRPVDLTDEFDAYTDLLEQASKMRHDHKFYGYWHTDDDGNSLDDEYFPFPDTVLSYTY